jgi:uncharacterized protein (DUF952 family)
MAELIFHMCRADEWEAALRSGAYPGSSQDQADGFIHFSTAAQIAASAAKHRAGQAGLLVLAVDPDRLAGRARLEWEEARGGALFPHIYGSLPVDAVVRSAPLPLGPDGLHRFAGWVGAHRVGAP